MKKSAEYRQALGDSGKNDNARVHIQSLIESLASIPDNKSVRILGSLLLETGEIIDEEGESGSYPAEVFAQEALGELASDFHYLHDYPMKGSLEERRTWWRSHYKEFGATEVSLFHKLPPEATEPKPQKQEIISPSVSASPAETALSTVNGTVPPQVTRTAPSKVSRRVTTLIVVVSVISVGVVLVLLWKKK